MHWEPTPWPDMSQDEYDDLERQMRAAGNRWVRSWWPRE